MAKIERKKEERKMTISITYDLIMGFKITKIETLQKKPSA